MFLAEKKYLKENSVTDLSIHLHVIIANFLSQLSIAIIYYQVMRRKKFQWGDTSYFFFIFM